MCVAESERASGVFHSGAATSSLSLSLVFYRLAREISEEISGWLCVCVPPVAAQPSRALSLSRAGISTMTELG